jgi:hypothetical protein
MAIANVNQITATLRMMSDPQLQQYAMMHKNDPYILPMAISESNSRKQVRAQGQAQGMGQPQPKVADANIAGMLPEDQGIGALPAPNMARMADGGIAGYADGGMDEQGAYNSEPVIRMAEGGVAHFRDAGRVRGPYNDDTVIYDPATGQPISGDYSTSGNDDRTMLERLGVFNPENRRALERSDAAIRARSAGVPTTAVAPVTPYNPDTASRAEDYAAAKTNLRSVPGPRPAPFAAAPAAAAPAAPAAPAQSTAERYMAMQNAMGTADRTALADRQTALEEEMNQAALDRDAAKEREIAERGKYGEAKEARITKREAALGKEKDQMSGLALIEAGLGIMSTPGPLAVAIGKGAKEGLKSYGEGLAKLKMAQERIDDARDQIDELRRTEANMTAKERRESTDDINKTKLEAKRLGLAAAEKMYGYDRDDTKAIFTADTQALLTDKEITSKEKISANEIKAANARSNAQIAATLNTPDRLVFNQLVKDNNNDAVKAAEALQKMKAEKFNMYEAYSKYLTGFAGKDQAIVGAPENFTKFASRFGTLTAPAPVDTNKPTRQ